ncbi:MAG: hypothetical protein L0H15_10900 [Nitrosospira sp.]|nr:hypothetical protein [Nitrosospira sp.]MDN5881986.1 hypothetical protein [Nitrosospira sp.]
MFAILHRHNDKRIAATSVMIGLDDLVTVVAEPGWLPPRIPRTQRNIAFHSTLDKSRRNKGRVSAIASQRFTAQSRFLLLQHVGTTSPGNPNGSAGAQPIAAASKA